MMREAGEQKFRESEILEEQPVVERELWSAHWNMLTSRKLARVLRLLRQETELRTSL